MASFNHNNRICVVCRKSYAYCSGCPEFLHLEPWHTIFHDSNCRSIFYIAYDFENGKITKEEAQTRLGECDLSNKDKFSDSIKESVQKILTSENAETSVRAKNDIDIEENTETEDIQKTVRGKSRKRGF